MAVILRELIENDVPTLARLANDWSIAQHTSDAFPHPYTEQYASEFIAAQQQAHKAGGWTARAIVESASEKLVGCCGVFSKPGAGEGRNTVCVGYWLGAPYRQKGYCSAALQLTVDEIFMRAPRV